MKLVLDTSVVIAAVQSSSGASNLLLHMALRCQFQLLVSVPLILEYEAVLTRTEHRMLAGLSLQDAHRLLDTIIDVATPLHLGFFWPHSAHDENDTHVLNLATVGKADALVTHDLKHFATAAEQVGVDLETPDGMLRRFKN